MKAILVMMLCCMVRIGFLCVGFSFGAFYNFSFRFWGEMLERSNLSTVLVESVKKTT